MTDILYSVNHKKIFSCEFMSDQTSQIHITVIMLYGNVTGTGHVFGHLSEFSNTFVDQFINVLQTQLVVFVW